MNEFRHRESSSLLDNERIRISRVVVIARQRDCRLSINNETSLFISDSWICFRAAITKIDSRIVALFSTTVLNGDSRLMHVREQKRDRRYRTSLVVRSSNSQLLFENYPNRDILREVRIRRRTCFWFWLDLRMLLEPHRNDLKSHIVIFASSRFELNVCKDRCNHDIRLTIAFISNRRLLQSLSQWSSSDQVVWTSHSLCKILAAETMIDDDVAFIMLVEISMISWPERCSWFIALQKSS